MGPESPYYIRPNDRKIQFLPGLYQLFESIGRSGEKIQVGSFGMLTHPANELMANIHNDGEFRHQMPLFLTPELEQFWVSQHFTDNDMQAVFDYCLPPELLDYHTVFSVRGKKPRPDGKPKFEFWKYDNLPPLGTDTPPEALSFRSSKNIPKKEPPRTTILYNTRLKRKNKIRSLVKLKPIMKRKKLDVSELETKWICHECIGSKDLVEIVLDLSKRRHKCLYCRNTNHSIQLKEFAEIIDSVFEESFEITPSEPDSYQERLHNDKESEYDWEREGEPFIYVLQDTAMIEEDVANDIQAILEEKHTDLSAAMNGEYFNPYDNDTYYTLKEFVDDTWDEELVDISNRIKYKSRFFDPIVNEFFKSLFTDVEKIHTDSTRKIFFQAGPNEGIEKLFRARVFQSDEDMRKALKNPEKNLGPPPASLARAGRMNPFGVSTFYGALDKSTALAEVRPPISSKVVIAEFNIVKRINLLDITALKNTYVRDSVFSKKYKEKARQAYLVREICELMSKPVLPNSEEFDYIITQAIADYLANQKKHNINGILYPSVQQNGKKSNVVLFPESAKVRRPTRHKNAGPELHYYRVGEDEYEHHLEEKGPLTWLETTNHDATLQLNKNAITIEQLIAISYTSNSNSIIYEEVRTTKKNEFGREAL